MLDVVVALFALRLSYIDIKSHLIRNADLSLYAIPLAIHTHRLSLAQTILMVFMTLVLSLILKIGGGDFKLFSLLIITQGSLLLTHGYFLIFLTSILASLLLTCIRNRRWGASVPLAPAILAPFLLSYLDI